MAVFERQKADRQKHAVIRPAHRGNYFQTGNDSNTVFSPIHLWYSTNINGQQKLEFYFRNLNRKANLMQTAKEEVVEVLSNLPDDATLEEIQYRLYVRQKIKRGIDDIDNARFVSQENVEDRMRRWIEK